MVCTMYFRRDLVLRVTELADSVSSNGDLVQCCYNRRHNFQIGFATIFKIILTDI